MTSPTDTTTLTAPTLRVRIRWMTTRDLFPVLLIEDESCDYPWTDEEFRGTLRQRGTYGEVAEHDGRIVGFMIYELKKTRIHVLNFAVAADARRRGVGTQMIARLVEKLSEQCRSRITLEVRESNVAAQLFWRECEFRAVAVLWSFYGETPEDAYRMVRRVSVDEGLACKREGVR